MPWDEITPRTFAALDKDLAGISRQTMEDHYKLYEGQVAEVNECRAILAGFGYGELEANQAHAPLRSVSVDDTVALLGAKTHELQPEPVGRLRHGPAARARFCEHAYAPDFGATPDGRPLRPGVLRPPRLEPRRAPGRAGGGLPGRR